MIFRIPGIFASADQVTPLFKILLVVPLQSKIQSPLCDRQDLCDLLVQSHFPPLLLLVLSLCPSKTELLTVQENFILLYASFFVCAIPTNVLRFITHSIYLCKKPPSSWFPLHFVYILIESNYFIIS